MVVSPSIDRSTPRRIGRPVSEETLPERVEGQFYEISAELVYARGHVEATAGHDAEADRSVERIARIARAMLAQADKGSRYTARLILAACADYARHDAAEDAAVLAAGVRINHAHAYSRAGAGLIEAAATGRRRGRLPRRMAKASQESLL